MASIIHTFADLKRRNLFIVKKGHKMRVCRKKSKIKQDTAQEKNGGYSAHNVEEKECKEEVESDEIFNLDQLEVKGIPPITVEMEISQLKWR